MKKLLLSLFLISSFTSSTHTSQWIFSNGIGTSAIGGLSHPFLTTIKQAFNIGVFIESGTGHGGFTQLAKGIFPQVHTIELFEPLYLMCRQKFIHDKNVRCYQGESADILRDIVQHIQGRPFFCLDAHYCGDNTALGRSATPILEELAVIKEAHIQDCIILIDDIRCFGTTLNGQEFPNVDTYPSVQVLYDTLLQVNEHFNVLLIGDQIFAYDPQLAPLTISPVLAACSASRLERNLTDQEIMHNESIIGRAQGQEKSFIIELYHSNKITYPQSKEYHAYLWYGLVSLHNNNGLEAIDAFNHIIEQGYDHWRIYLYLTQAAKAAGLKAISSHYAKVTLDKNPSCDQARALAR